MDQTDQHYNDKTPNTIKFEGTPDEFVQVCLAYGISNKKDSFPYKWIRTTNPHCFVLYRSGPDSDYYPVSVLASPLPKSRSLLTFQILIREYDKYRTICQKLVDYLRGLGWIKSKNDESQEPEVLFKNNESAEHKNKSRIDAIDRVAVALYAKEKGEIPTYSSAAMRFKTHTETITKYANDPSVLKKLEEFRIDPTAYLRCKQMVSSEKRRK